MNKLTKLVRPTGLRAVAIALCTLLLATAAPSAHAEVVAVCVVRAEKPHDSSHFGGTMSAIGRIVTCHGSPIPDLHLDVQLQRYRDGEWRVVPATRKMLRQRGNVLRAGRFRVCSVGLYRTRVRGFAFGQHSPWFYSGSRLILCGGGTGSGGGGGGGW